MGEGFFLGALAAGVGIALTSGPLGCLIIWRRMAYLGDTMAHSALLGIALAVILGWETTLGVLIVVGGLSLGLLLIEEQGIIPTDALLATLAHSTLAIGLLLFSLLPGGRIDVHGFLFGDILLVTLSDLVTIYVGGATILTITYWLWRPLLVVTISPALARAEGISSLRNRLVFSLMISAVIAVTIKIVGVLLTTSLFIIPALTVRPWVRTPEQMAVAASVVGSLDVVVGLLGSLHWDTPSGPTIVMVATGAFMVSFGCQLGLHRR